MNTHLVYCDGPDLDTATCVGVPATGIMVSGDGFTAGEYAEMLGAIVLLFGLAYIVRLVLRTMGFR